MQNLITVIAPQILVAGAYSFVGEIRSVVFELRWMLVFIVAMIIADFVLVSLTAWSSEERISAFPEQAAERCASSSNIIRI